MAEFQVGRGESPAPPARMETDPFGGGTLKSSPDSPGKSGDVYSSEDLAKRALIALGVGSGLTALALAATAKLPAVVVAATGVATAAEGGLTIAGAALGVGAGIAVGGALLVGVGAGLAINKGYEYTDGVMDDAIQRAIRNSVYVPERYRGNGWKIRPA